MALVKQASEKKAKREPDKRCFLTELLDVELLRTILSFLDIMHCHQTAEVHRRFNDACSKMPEYFYDNGLLDAEATGGPICALGGSISDTLLLKFDARPDAKQLAIDSGLEHCFFCDKLTTRRARRSARLYCGAVVTEIARPLLGLEEGYSACAACCGDRLVAVRYVGVQIKKSVDELLAAGLNHYRSDNELHTDEEDEVPDEDDIPVVQYVFSGEAVRAFCEEKMKMLRT